MNNVGIIPYIDFEEMLSQLDNDEWMKQIVVMVSFVNKNGMNEEAAFMYKSLFGVKAPLNESVIN